MKQCGCATAGASIEFARYSPMFGLTVPVLPKARNT